MNYGVYNPEFLLTVLICFTVDLPVLVCVNSCNLKTKSWWDLDSYQQPTMNIGCGVYIPSNFFVLIILLSVWICESVPILVVSENCIRCSISFMYCVLFLNICICLDLSCLTMFNIFFSFRLAKFLVWISFPIGIHINELITWNVAVLCIKCRLWENFVAMA